VDKLIIFLGILVAFLIVSNMDYQNELVAEQAYKRDVCKGIYPNYKNLKLDCKEN